jgi:DNA-binding transcriptional LysR family regulator
MDVALLKAFVAVSDSGSFSLAAATLHLTQPAISKRVQQLETQLDTLQFDRIGRLVTPTEAGRLLYPRARHILQELHDTERAIHDLDGAIAGTLTLGTSHHIGLHRLPPVLREFRRGCPEVSLDIAFMDSEQAHDAVLQGRLEIGVITLPPQGVQKKLASQVIWPDPLSIMVATEHALGREETVSLAQLAAHPAVLPGPGTYTGQILRQLFASANITLDISMSTNYLETLRMLVAIGLGWSLLPASMLTDDLHAPALAGRQLSRQLGLIYHRDRSLSNAARRFIDTLTQAESPAWTSGSQK